MRVAKVEKDMKILVTGSHGMLGSAFVEILKKRRIPYVPYDRAHPEAIDSDITAVVHFAGITPYSFVKGKAPSATAYRAANVAGTATLLDALSRAKKLTRFINIGSAAELGFSPRPFLEDSPCHPDNPYGESKLAQSALVKAFARTRSVKTFNLRVFNITGFTDHRSTGRPASGRPHLFTALANQFGGEPPRVIEVNSAKDVRDFVVPEDVLEAIFVALIAEAGGTYEVINICSGRGTTISDVVELFGKVLHSPYTLKSLSRTQRASVGVAKKAERLLGWRPKISLERAIKNYVGGAASS